MEQQEPETKEKKEKKTKKDKKEKKEKKEKHVKKEKKDKKRQLEEDGSSVGTSDRLDQHEPELDYAKKKTKWLRKTSDHSVRLRCAPHSAL
jgi:hypothetical protein